MKKIFSLLSVLLFVVACAGSAEHQVVSAHRSGDSNLDCRGIDGEIVRAQVIIDGVNQDKSGMSGADWIDGILWFPFNLIAKSNNYKNATQAADRRIERLETLKKEKSCSDSSAENKTKSAGIVAELNQLSEMYKAGDLTKSEYKKAKQEILNSN